MRRIRLAPTFLVVLGAIALMAGATEYALAGPSVADLRAAVLSVQDAGGGFLPYEPPGPFASDSAFANYGVAFNRNTLTQGQYETLVVFLADASTDPATASAAVHAAADRFYERVFYERVADRVAPLSSLLGRLDLKAKVLGPKVTQTGPPIGSDTHRYTRRAEIGSNAADVISWRSLDVVALVMAVYDSGFGLAFTGSGPASLVVPRAVDQPSAQPYAEAQQMKLVATLGAVAAPESS